MKPTNRSLALVTASLPLAHEDDHCVWSWDRTSAYGMPLYHIWGKYGVVPAFAEGVALAFEHGAEAVCCFHDDLLIEQPDWDLMVLDALDRGVKFMGFGGGTSLGRDDLYKAPYDPMQLARGGFVSNMRDAEAHGKRSTKPVPCVCFDGFCQIGTKDWFKGAWEWLAKSGVQHHFYDGMLGCLAARAGVQPGLMLPIACHHYGGRTAVGSAAYNEWARTQNEAGDGGFWAEAHALGYACFKDVLPLRVEQFQKAQH